MRFDEPFLLRLLLAVLSFAPVLALPGGPIQTPSESRSASERRQDTAKSSTPITSSPSISAAPDQCKTPYGGLPNLCTKEMSLPPYTSAYSAGTSLKKAASSPSPTPTGPPICENQADPDNDGPDYCYCTQGSLTTSVAPVTGSGGLCPWTSLPITNAGPMPTFTPPPQTGTGLYSYTDGYEVIGCQSTIVSMEDNEALTSCTGKTYIISERPHATVQVGSSTQNVGTLSSAGLYTAVSNALTSVCPTPSSGSSTGCTAAATITGVSYTFNETVELKVRNIGGLDGDIDDAEGAVIKRTETPHLEKRLAGDPLPLGEETVIKSDGELIVNVLTSNYTSRDILNSMIVLAASTFAASASGKACTTVLDKQPDGAIYGRQLAIRDSAPSTVLCGATHFAGVEYTNWALDSSEPAAFLGVELDFHEGMAEVLDTAFECEEMINGFLAIVGDIFPELAPLELDSEELVAAGCEAAMTIGDLIN